MTSKFARLVPISCAEEVVALQKMAASDKHDVVAPTHLVVKEGRIVGYMSIGNIPVVFAWLSTKDLHARDSFHLIHLGEQMIQLGGWRSVLLPTDDGSPFTPLMESMGYKSLAKVQLNHKEFKPFNLCAIP